VKSPGARKALGYVWGTVATLLLWWLAAVLLNTPALPTPLESLGEFVAQLPAIAPEFAVSTGRILVAMLAGTVLGAPLGLLLGRSKRADAVFSPILYVLYPVPKIVFLPVLFVIFGLGGEGKVVLIAIALFFQVMLSMRDAAKGVPVGVVEALRSLGGSKRDVFTSVVVPLTIPELFTSLRVSTGTAVAILFIAESMAGNSGLGYFIMHAWSLLDYQQMFAGIVAMAVLGVVLYEAFDIAEKHLTKWRRA